MAKEKRFKKVYSQGMGDVEIWVDKKTGVNYLYHQRGTHRASRCKRQACCDTHNRGEKLNNQ